MPPMPTVPRFNTSKSTLGAIVALALSAALAIGFVSAYWRAWIDPARRAVDVACDATSSGACRQG
jgi:hypothetical protein